MILLINHDNPHACPKTQFVNAIKQGGCFLLLVVPLVVLILLSSRVRASTKNTNSSLEFLDDGTLALDAQGVPLATLLGDIQKKIHLEFTIHEGILEKPISVSFQSLPLNKAIKRILHGVSYACIFGLSGNIEKVITFPTANEVKEYSPDRNIPSIGLSYEATMEIIPPPKDEDIEEAMGIMPPPQDEDLAKAMKGMGTTPPSELTDLMKKAMATTPPHKLLGFMKLMKKYSLLRAVEHGKNTGIVFPSEQENP
jgi:hypothetical protein